jgi:hypothetical protein
MERLVAAPAGFAHHSKLGFDGLQITAFRNLSKATTFHGKHTG